MSSHTYTRDVEHHTQRSNEDHWGRSVNRPSCVRALYLACFPPGLPGDVNSPRRKRRLGLPFPHGPGPEEQTTTGRGASGEPQLLAYATDHRLIRDYVKARGRAAAQSWAGARTTTVTVTHNTNTGGNIEILDGVRVCVYECV